MNLMKTAWRGLKTAARFLAMVLVGILMFCGGPLDWLAGMAALDALENE